MSLAFSSSCSLQFYSGLMQIRFKIQSFSSQNDNYPAGNLLSRHSYWQSERFCDFPQEITISFYQPMTITGMKIGAHPTKISSRINILTHLPEHNDQGFMKYGFLTFSDSQTAVEVKQLNNIEIRAIEIRLLLLRNHTNVNNFFNQVGLSLLSFTGIPYEQHVIPVKVISNRSTVLSFDPQVNLLTQLKLNFIKREQFEQAKQVKQILNFIDRASIKMEEFESQKQKCIKDEDFLGAKRVKEEMLAYKDKMTDVVNNLYDPEKKVLRSIKSDAALRQKVEEMNLGKGSSFMSEGSEPRNSRIREQSDFLKAEKEVISEGEEDIVEERNESIVSYEDRILPAVMSRIKGMGKTQLIPESSQIGDNQFFESGDKGTQLPAEPEKLSPADEANSSHLLQFYDSAFIRKIHSRFWQFRLEAITQVLEELKVNKEATLLSKNKLRCYLFIYSLSLKSHNYQTANASLELMNLLAPMRSQADFKQEMHNELESAFKNTLNKLNDSNQKIKSHSEKTLLRIIESSLFGVAICYSAIIKSYPEKVNAKLRKIKLQDIEYIVEKYGVGENGVPMNVVDFALKAANDQDAEVRKSAITLVKSVKMRGGKDRLESMLNYSMGVKPSVVKLIAG